MLRQCLQNNAFVAVDRNTDFLTQIMQFVMSRHLFVKGSVNTF